MSTWGGAVPWHRVVHADGTPAPSHDGEVLRLLRADVTPMRGDRVDMRQARWNPDSQVRASRPRPAIPQINRSSAPK